MTSAASPKRGIDNRKSMKNKVIKNAVPAERKKSFPPELKEVVKEFYKHGHLTEMAVQSGIRRGTLSLAKDNYKGTQKTLDAFTAFYEKFKQTSAA